MPKVSVHIATRNNERFIAEAIRSVLAEPYKDLELIVLDDASTDGNWTAIQKAVEGAANAKAVRAGSRLGEAKARHRLTDMSDSKYTLVVDGDDLLVPGSLEERIAFLDANESYAGAYGKLCSIDASGSISGNVIGRPFSRFSLAFGNSVCHPGHLLRRSDVVAAGGNLETGAGPDSVAEDLYLWLRLALSKDFKFFNRFVCLYRTHSGQLSNTGSERLRKAESWMMKEILALRPDIAEPLLKGTPLSLGKDDIRAASTLLSIFARCSPEASEPLDGILDAAGRLDPLDYGVALKRQELFFKRGDCSKALACCEQVLEGFKDEPILVFAALKLKRETLEAAGTPFDKAALEAEMERARRSFVELPQEILSMMGA